ncbi:MAG TPA: tellurite resistance TerB family protein [Kofleriaceae bacterium]|nr:tellurite resistance TerB family protein [Kofleriaceae bacterium]
MERERSVKDLLGGGLKPNDPRRFLIEAMVAAMSADGHIDARETTMMEQLIADHPLFAGLGAKSAKTLVQLSKDAIQFAGGSVGRAPAIAKGLPARIQRLAAYGMAAEIANADEKIDPSELAFLEALRLALRIAPAEAEQIIQAARESQLEPYLEDRYLRIKGMISVAAEVFALRALGRGVANDEQRFKVRDFFLGIPDLALTSDELDAELYRAFRRPRAPDAQVFGELSRIASTMPGPVDRYWMVVYTLVAEQPSSVPSWRVIPFIGVMQAAFQIVDADMELAAIDALTFPANLPRPA